MNEQRPLERCGQCDEPTGRAGKGEDSIYFDSIDCGPLCERCQDALVEEVRESYGIPGVSVRVAELEADLARLRERCASDPWWWAYSEYLDEGWCGPFETREDAEASADDAIGPPRQDDDPPRSADDERPEISYRQHSNPEGCAENERLEGEVARLRKESQELFQTNRMGWKKVDALREERRVLREALRGAVSTVKALEWSDGGRCPACHKANPESMENCRSTFGGNPQDFREDDFGHACGRESDSWWTCYLATFLKRAAFAQAEPQGVDTVGLKPMWEAPTPAEPTTELSREQWDAYCDLIEAQTEPMRVAPAEPTPAEPNAEQMWEWAETHPEAAMRAMTSWWANAGVGFREERFYFRNVIRAAMVEAEEEKS